MTLSECWWIDETPWPGPRSTAVIYYAFPKGQVSPGDLYYNEERRLLYRWQQVQKTRGGKTKTTLDWVMVAQSKEDIDRYLEIFYDVFH